MFLLIIFNRTYLEKPLWPSEIICKNNGFFVICQLNFVVFFCSPGCLGTHFVDQAGLRDSPASASGVLELKVYTTTNGQSGGFFIEVFSPAAS